MVHLLGAAYMTFEVTGGRSARRSAPSAPLPEILLKQVHDLVLAHLLGRGDQAPVRAYLEMLDLYNRGVDRAVAQVFVLRLLHDQLSFAHQPLGGLVRRSLGLLTKLLEDLLKVPSLLLGLAYVVFDDALLMPRHPE